MVLIILFLSLYGPTTATTCGFRVKVLTVDQEAAEDTRGVACHKSPVPCIWDCTYVSERGEKHEHSDRLVTGNALHKKRKKPLLAYFLLSVEVSIVGSKGMLCFRASHATAVKVINPRRSSPQTHALVCIYPAYHTGPLQFPSRANLPKKRIYFQHNIRTSQKTV